MRVRLSVLLLLGKVVRLLSCWCRLLRLEPVAALQFLALDLVGRAGRARLVAASDDGSANGAHPALDRDQALREGIENESP